MSLLNFILPVQQEPFESRGTTTPIHILKVYYSIYISLFDSKNYPFKIRTKKIHEIDNLLFYILFLSHTFESTLVVRQ